LAYTIKQALNSASSLALVSDNWHLESELLLGHVLNVSREHLFTWPDEAVSAELYQGFSDLLQRRQQGEPVAYLRGKQAFWSFELLVNSDVLIPRPETELLVEKALAVIDSNASEVAVADLGTGSGAIALALATEKPGWALWAVDKSSAALNVAEKNAAMLGLENVRFATGDWCSELPRQHFDAIIANPPYVEAGNSHLSQGSLPFEPLSALVAGNKGMADIEAIIEQSRSCLKTGGWLLIEHGFDQSENVVAALITAGFTDVAIEMDLAGIPRIAFAQWQG
jgi:release factor glutamine methyltransferase